MRSEYFNNFHTMAKMNLKNLLSQCTKEQQELFKKMYPKGINNIAFNKLDWAFYQIENAIKDNHNKNELKKSSMYGVELEDINNIDEVLYGCQKPCLHFNATGRLNNLPKDSLLTEIKFDHSVSTYKQLLSIIKHCEDDNGENFKTLIIDQIDDLTSIHFNYISNPPDAFAASADELMKYSEEENHNIINLFGKLKTLNLDIILIYDHTVKKRDERIYQDLERFILKESDYVFGFKQDLSTFILSSVKPAPSGVGYKEH